MNFYFFNFLAMCITTLIGIVLCVNQIKRVRTLAQEGSQAVGTVIGHKIRIGRGSVIHPIISFTTKNGQNFKVQGPAGLKRKGETLVVYYDPDRPHHYTVDPERDQNGPILLLYLLFVLVAIAIYYMLF